MDQVQIPLYKFTDISETPKLVLNWLSSHPCTKLKFKNINETSTFIITLNDEEYEYDIILKTLKLNGEWLTEYNSKSIIDNDITSVLNEMHDTKIIPHVDVEKIMNNPWKKYKSTFSDDSDNSHEIIDSDKIEFETNLQNLRKAQKSVNIVYTMHGTDVAKLSFHIHNIQFDFSYFYNIVTHEFSNLSFFGSDFSLEMPDPLLIWIMNNEWLSIKDIGAVSKFIIGALIVAEPYQDHKLNFNKESLELFKMHEITLDNFEWTDTTVNICPWHEHLHHDHIIVLLNTILIKLKKPANIIENQHVNAICPIINYYFKSDNIYSLLNNMSIYKLMLEIAKIFNSAYNIDVPINCTMALQKYILSETDTIQFEHDHSMFIYDIGQL